MATGSWKGPGDTRVFRANIQFRHGSQNCQTGFHLRDVGINTLSPQDVCEEVAEFATTQFVKLLHQVDSVTGIDVANLATSEGYFISPTGASGTEPGALPPPFVTIPISLKGNIRKRYGNGRMLWPMWNREAADNGVLIPAAQAIVAGVVADMTTRFMSSGVGATMRLVHLHDLLKGVGTRPDIPPTWYDVTSIRVNNVVSSLRRRKAGVGS